MTTKQGSFELADKVRPTAIESVKFRDGMIVTAEDLEAAQSYPVSVLRTVLRSYLGCGVVCGLNLRVKESGGTSNWVVCVEQGVAIDCHGYPLELCRSVELDLSPDPCDCDDPPAKICIAVRRITSEEAPQDACSCDVDAPHFDCRRVREHVVIKAFTEAQLGALPPGTVCQRQPSPGDDSHGCGQPKQGSKPDSVQSWSEVLCDSLTGCSPCTCGDCWVLLGCVKLEKDKGIIGDPETDKRQWVKPIEAICPTLIDKIIDLEKQVADYQTLSDRIKKLEDQISGLTKSAPQTSPTAQGAEAVQDTHSPTAPGQ